MLSFIGLLLAGLAIAVAALIGYTVVSLVRPPRRTYATALARGTPADPGELEHPLAFSEWKLESRGTELEVWDIPGTCREGPTVVLCHGWGDSKMGSLSRLPLLAAHASRIIAWDMPGHGDAGSVCSLGCREAEDLAALLSRVASNRVVLMGWSLGGGVCIDAASRGLDGVVGVVAEAPYRLGSTPAKNMLRSRVLPYRINVPAAMWLLGAWFDGAAGYFDSNRFDRAELARRVRVPLLVVHGTEDEICPPEDGRAIAEAGGGTFLPVAGGGHLHLWSDPATSKIVREGVENFLARIADTQRHYDA